MLGLVNPDQQLAIVGVKAMNELNKRNGHRIEHLQNLAEDRRCNLSTLIADIVSEYLDDHYCNDCWIGDDLYPGNHRLKREAEEEYNHAIWAGR